MNRWSATLILLVVLGCEGTAELDAPETLEGTISHQVVSRAEQGWSREAFVLTTADGGETELLFATAPRVATGERVRVSGRRLGEGERLGARRLRERILVASLERLAPATQTALVLEPGTPVPSRNILVVLFNFKNDDRQYYTKEQIQQRVLDDKDSVRTFYGEQSFGLIQLAGKQNPKGDVSGWHTLDTYNIPCQTTQWANLALEAARKDGLDTSAYQHFIFYFPSSPACDFSGLATVGGRFTWISGSTISTMAHEFGHSFGLRHSNSYECRDRDLRRVTFSEDCAHVEYGNPFDLMGRGGLRHTNAYNKAVAGWLGGSNIISATSSGVYRIVPQEQPTNEPQLLVVPRDATTSYFLEFRQPFGFDNFSPEGTAVNGVMLLVGTNLRGRDSPVSWLLDTTPATSTLDDAPLTRGRTFRDPMGVLAITLVGHGPMGAEIRVDIPAPAVDGGAEAGVRADAGADGAGSPLEPSRSDAGTGAGGDGPGGSRPAREDRSGCSCALGAAAPAGGGALPLALLALVVVSSRRRRLPVVALILVALLGAAGCPKSPVSPPAPDATSDTTAPGIDAAAPDAAASTPLDAAVAAPDAGPLIVVTMAPPEVATLCDREAEFTCRRMAECHPVLFAELYNDARVCQARVTSSCRGLVLDPSRRLPPPVYAACVADILEQSCHDVYYRRRPSSCISSPGNGALDAPCATARDCGMGLTCRVGEGARCGTCVQALAAGARCSVTPRECVMGTRCVRDECTIDLKVGEPCKRTVASCEAGLSCTDSGCAERTGQKGASCAKADICDPTKSLYCNLATGLCDDLPPPAGRENDPCSDYTLMGYQNRCGAGLYCEENAGTVGGRCRKLAALAEACDDLRGPRCTPPAVCSSRRCLMPDIVPAARPPTFAGPCQ